MLQVVSICLFKLSIKFLSQFMSCCHIANAKRSSNAFNNSRKFSVTFNVLLQYTKVLHVRDRIDWHTVFSNQVILRGDFMSRIILWHENNLYSMMLCAKVFIYLCVNDQKSHWMYLNKQSMCVHGHNVHVHVHVSVYSSLF